MPTHSPEWDAASSVIKRAMRLTAELNKLSFDDVAKVRTNDFSGDTRHKAVWRNILFSRGPP